MRNKTKYRRPITLSSLKLTEFDYLNLTKSHKC